MKIIDSDALLKQLGISERFNNADIPAYVIGIIKSMPSAERKGRWIEAYEDERKQIGWYECSECKYAVSWKANFCPNCGARMVIK